MADYLRPETLFNKTKFDGYYAARNEPIHEIDQRNNPRLIGVYRGITDYGELAKRKMEQHLAKTSNQKPSDASGTRT